MNKNVSYDCLKILNMLPIIKQIVMEKTNKLQQIVINALC